MASDSDYRPKPNVCLCLYFLVRMSGITWIYDAACAVNGHLNVCVIWLNQYQYIGFNGQRQNTTSKHFIIATE